MAYVNVKDWSVDQVTDWLKGLDNVILPYTKSFLNNEVKGQQLLNLRSDDLEHLGVFTLGHQEIILEAVEHLRNFHYELDKENLQMLALRLSCAANSLYKELLLADDNCTMVPTQTMSNVHNIIATIKPLVCWLDRSPFRGDKDYMDTKIQLLQLSFEMATSAHRDIFSEKPVRTIRDIGETLARLADHIIQEITDPMILQPASLDLATLKKKEQELGFSLLPSNHAIHQIAEIKYGSPAHNSTKIEEGDEIVQVNYQTVVGWQRKKVVLLLQDAPPEIVLTLKKRPRHTKVYGQIYMKPYRLPSRKRASPYSRWNDDLPSPQLLAMPDMPQICYKPKPVIVAPEIETSSSDSEPPDSPLDVGGRVYPLKPQPVLQRRNTITGASPTSKRPHQAIEQYWQLLKNQAASKHASSYNIQTDKFPEESMVLRDKSVSCGHGLELVPRPSTVIGITQTRNFDFQNKSKKKVNFEEKVLKPEPDLNEEKSVSVNSLTSLHLTNETINFIDEGEDLMDRSNMSIHWQQEIIEEIIDNIRPKKDVAVLSEVDVQGIIKKFDANAPKLFQKNSSTDFKKPVVPPRTITKLRGKLDKSHSTPAYDTTPENDFETEPVQFELGIPIVETSNLAVNLNLSKHQEIDVPPKPPPRSVPDSPKPRYPFDSPKPVEYTKRIPSITETELPKGTARNVEMSFESPKMKSFEPKCTSTPEVEPPLIKITPSDGPTTKVSPTNSVVRAVIYSSRTKTGKKKSSLIAKRRKVGVKDVTPGELQGYLYLRLRSKRDQMVHWEKRWVVLTGSCLYGFKTKEASKADSFIYLAGFTVSLATEVFIFLNAVRSNSAICSPVYGGEPCSFLPAPPGHTPPCARPGLTYCEHPPHYPGQVIEYLVQKWRFDHKTLLVDETREEFNSYFIPVHDKYGPKPFPTYGPPNSIQHDNHLPDPIYIPKPGFASFPTPSNTYIPVTTHFQNFTDGFAGYPDRRPQYHPFEQSLPSNQLYNFKHPRNVPGTYSQPEASPYRNIYAAITQPQITHYNDEWLKRYTRDISTILRNERSKRTKRYLRMLNTIDEANNGTHSRTKRQSGITGQVLCQARSQYIMPRAALNNKGNWMYVVNMPELDNRLTQLVKSETCVSQQCSGLCSLPTGYTSRCEQKYVQKRLVALEGSGNQLYTDVFWFPSCCVCTLSNN